MANKKFSEVVEEYRRDFLSSGKTAKEYELDLRHHLTPGGWSEDDIRNAIELITCTEWCNQSNA